MASPRTYAVLAVLAALICGFSLLRGIDAFDEGLALQAANRIVDGQLPYADYLYPYGPGQPFLLGGFQEIFGPSLLTWRVIRLAIDVGVSLVVFTVVRRAAPLPFALLAWLIATTAMAQPLSANPFPFALLLALLAVAAATSDGASLRGALLAGVLTAVAAAWRLDFGAYAAAACIAAIALRPDDRSRRALAYVGALATVVLVVYGPFFAAAGPEEAWDALVAKSFREHEWWTLPFPFSYHGGFGSPREWKDVLDFYVPLILLIGTAVAAAITIARGLYERTPPWSWIAWVVLGIGFVQYLLSRTDPFHETPLIVALAIVLAMSAAWSLARSAGRWRITLAGASLAVLLLLAAAGTANRVSALFSPPDLDPVHLAAADGVDAEPIEARALPEAVHRVQELVPPGEPIHVVTRRSDLVRVGNPLFPYLAQRPTVLDRDFDLWTSADAQRDIVTALEEKHPLVIVRWNHPTTVRREDNRRGEPSGSRILDAYLEREYRIDARFGWYEILVPR